MNLKNYTSSIPASTTISYIESHLAACGVNGITKQYEGLVPVALFFHVELENNRYTIRLPANVAQVCEVLWNDYRASVRTPRKQKSDFMDQASRTAWKIQQDWVQVQMSLIKLKQADFRELFMGFLWDGKRSYFQALKDGGFRALLPEQASQAA